MSEVLRVKDFSALIYDLDDTLVDNAVRGINAHKVSKFEAFNKASHYFGITRLAEITLEQEADSFKRAPEHTIESGLRLLFSEVLPDLTIEEIEAIIDFVVVVKNDLHPEVMRTHVGAIKGAREFVTLAGLHGMQDRQAVATGSPRRDADYALLLSGMHRHFTPNRIVAKEDYASPKPDPEAFMTALIARLRLRGEDAKDAVVFEDDPKGLLAAHRAGMHAIALTTRFTQDELARVEGFESTVIAVVSDFEDVRRLFGL